MKGKFGGVLLAAGSSSRMYRGAAVRSKVMEQLGGEPAIMGPIRQLLDCKYIEKLCIVCREQDREELRRLTLGIGEKPVVFAEGGDTRQSSVRNGVEALSNTCDYVLIHDGARPLVSRETIAAVCEDAMKYGAATAAVRAKDTCKLSDAEGFVESTPCRDRLVAVQTPQGFRRELYEYAYEKARAAGREYTDDCQLIEAANGRVKLSAGDYKNIKLTTQEDLTLARALYALYEGERGERMEMNVRIGQGYDVHRLTPGRKLILGGVEVPFERGLLGHSDADVLTHAIADAILGAAALGDIGRMFPDNDPEYAGADSILLLKEVCERLRRAGYEIGNIDATLIAQRPKIAPYVEQMRGNIAAACGLELHRVSVKATTEEGMGFTGVGDGMAAQAVCLLRKE